MESNLVAADTAKCPSYRGRDEKKDRFSIHCGNSLPKRRKASMKIQYNIVGAIGLVLIGAIGLLIMGCSESKLVGKVNGEEITRKEFAKRVDRAKKFYKLLHGQEIFQGEEGNASLNRLKADIFDEIVTEKILLQEAKIAGYSSAPEEEIERQIEAVKKKHAFTDAELMQKMGVGVEDLKEELRKEWIISQFLERVVLKGNQLNGELLFAQWIAKAKAKAEIETYEKLEPVSAAKGSCCGSGIGSSRAQKSQSLDPKIERDAKAKGLEYYEKKTQKKGASATVTDFGCHIQVDIIENGKVVLSLTYQQGKVQEL